MNLRTLMSLRKVRFMGKIIEFPNDKKLRDKLIKLKENLEKLVFERDNLKYVICENIKSSYIITFGSYEYKLFKVFCKYHRLRRKKDMIQAIVNRNEKIDLHEIEKKLDLEFDDYKKKLDEKINEINKAINYSYLETLTKEDTILIKKLYRKIVRILHPDLNPEITDREKELFYNATQSYKLGDISTLKIIYDIISSDNIDKEKNLTGKSLIDEVKRLEDLVKKVQNNIDIIKSQTPYTWKIYIEDENKKIKKLNDLEKQIKSYEEAIKSQEECIKELLRD